MHTFRWYFYLKFSLTYGPMIGGQVNVLLPFRQAWFKLEL